MSRIKKIIEVIPPDYGHDAERYIMTGFECPKCNGRGYTMEWGERECRHVECYRCGGSGSLQATVRIEWESQKGL
jgi:uncharacterized metal-binding protein (TIGR02443 family)